MVIDLANVDQRLAVIAAIVVIAGVVATFVLHRLRRSVWQQFAAGHGLSLVQHERGPRITGEVGGHGVTLETVDESSDTGALGVEEIRMSLDVDCSIWPVGLRVESATNVLGDLEAHKITTGHESFDRDMLVTGRDQAAACGWLTADRRLALMDLAAHHSDKKLTLDGERISLQTRNAISRLQELDDMLESLVRAAEAIASSDGEPDEAADEPDTLTS